VHKCRHRRCCWWLLNTHFTYIWQSLLVLIPCVFAPDVAVSYGVVFFIGSCSGAGLSYLFVASGPPRERHPTRGVVSSGFCPASLIPPLQHPGPTRLPLATNHFIAGASPLGLG
ncbi:unnamed protein product, partial [Meganyctiphanes norvegica]